MRRIGEDKGIVFVVPDEKKKDCCNEDDISEQVLKGLRKPQTLMEEEIENENSGGEYKKYGKYGGFSILHKEMNDEK